MTGHFFMTLNERHSSELRAASDFFSSAFAGTACDIRGSSHGLQCRPTSIGHGRDCIMIAKVSQSSLVLSKITVLRSFEAIVHRPHSVSVTMTSKESITDSQSS